MVNNERTTLWRKGDIELEKERSDGGRDGLIGREGEQNVAIVVNIVDQDVGSQLRTEAL